ncbi:hypothetical protein G3I59_20425 [Amycolatopsis rubida]|uniref:Uncharacterized protein n=1 Tax=Amycolatopsis rubida TaxID=112413 RepID=A0ABX0BUI6_9PSEU|nr:MULTISPECIES: hypothetical protein [Amycolatopsis]MYW92912.1 hypothetical protein [Amycolatopsis rubida]NEC57899.1 hypothetical protein [Amycolatopsis rubida]OAP21633.1 hypothetical protein A4R44_07656 [Amycolatopsis sp. M39]
MTIVLVVADAVLAMVAAARAAALSHSDAPTNGEKFHGWMYAVRAVRPRSCR